MKKIALLFVMVFAFSLTQANNHAVVRNVLNQDATQTTTLNRIVNLQSAPVFHMVASKEVEAHTGNHAKRVKQSKAQKTNRKKNEQARKAKYQKKQAVRKAEHQKKVAARKAEHQKSTKTEHHHHKKAEKK